MMHAASMGCDAFARALGELNADVDIQDEVSAHWSVGVNSLRHSIVQHHCIERSCFKAEACG